MKKILPFICFFLINSFVFGQTKVERTKYFQEQQQKLIDTQNPIFAKIETFVNGKLDTEIILKTDTERINVFKENANKYFVQSIQNIPIKTILTKWEERKNVRKNCCGSSKPEDCIAWKLIEFPVDVMETVKTYRLKPTYYTENEIWQKNYEDICQKAIDDVQPIYTKIQLENGNEEIILKIDSTRIKEITTLSEKYIFEKVENVTINTATIQWMKRRPERPTCCLSANPDDCLIWALVEVPVYAIDTIKIYKLKPKKKAIVKDKYLYGTPEHEAYKAKEHQKRIDVAQPIYAKIQTQTKEGLIEKIIYKTDSVLIQELEKRIEDYILYDIEIVNFNVVGFEYWQKKMPPDINCCYAPYDDCIAWCMVEHPTFTATETIEIFRKRNVETIIAENETKVTLNTDIQGNQIEHRIYPNPFSDYIIVQSNVAIDRIIIFDEIGRNIFENQIQNIEKTVDLRHLKTGVYFVQIFTKNDKKTLKIIKH